MSRPRRVSVALVALSLLAVGLASAGTSRSFTISNGTADERTWMRGFDSPAMQLADFDGDGRAEIVAQNDNRVTYVLASDRPVVLAELAPRYPAGWGARPLNDPAVGDVDGDGILEVVVVTSAADVCVYEYVPGSSTSTRFSFAERWCRTMTSSTGGRGADAGAWLEDADGDGTLEIYSQTENKGLYAFDHDGRVRWTRDDWGGNAGPTVADLDGDGRKEALFFSDGGKVTALDASTGAWRWRFDASRYLWPASIPVSGAAGDLDGDGRLEVVFTARHAADTTDYRRNHLGVFVLDAWGGLKWWRQPSWANPLSYTHPVLFDLDGDGRKDVLLQDWNTIGHKPGNWERLGPANVFAYGTWGSLLWRTSLDNTWSNDDVGLADVDADGRMEVVALGRSSGADGAWYLDSRTGAKEQHVSSGGWESYRGPLVGDFDGSGDLDWALPVHGHERGGAVVVYDTDAPCRVAYGGWQNRDPCSPPRSTFGGGGGGGGGDVAFDHLGTNGWWVEVAVSPQATRVQAQDDNTGWTDLTYRPDWTPKKWADNLRVEPGHRVQFRALVDGAWHESCWFTHPEGAERCDGSPPPPPPPPEDVAFDHLGTNEWWVEVGVEPRPGSVEVRDDGGAWAAMTYRSDWSTPKWALGYHVEPGHRVQFRALVDGAWRESCWFTHPEGAERC